MSELKVPQVIIANMQEFHAILVDKSLSDQSIMNDLKIISHKNDGGWVLYKIKAAEQDLDLLISKIQSIMNPGGWYFHFYNNDGSKLIVVFRDKFFKISNDQSTWTDAINHGQKLGTPIEQLDFVPNTFNSEEY
jgi:hypothetical protein